MADITNLMPLRYVTIALAATLTGLTEKAIRRKIEEAKWVEGIHFRRRDNTIFVDLQNVEKWIDGKEDASPQIKKLARA